MSPETFAKASKLIESRLGIKMPVAKKVLLESRLQKRMRALNINSFEKYLFNTIVQSKNEFQTFIDIVTTNKTDFFREPLHFDYLKQVIQKEIEFKNVFNFWSAGCSSGEEAYTLCIILEELKIELNKNFSYKILGTDISKSVLQRAEKGIYHQSFANGITPSILNRYFLKSKNDANNYVKIKPNLSKNVSFKQLNFLDIDYNIPYQFDFIFYRNVGIYFNVELQGKVVEKITSSLKKGGYLFLGHSESLINMNLPYQQIKPTFYKK
ncbi:MAG: CheR family methyltransferase, partial [Bacteroidota bacterium]